MARRKQDEGPFPLDNDPLWYKDAIIYELHVRAFADSDGDGIGDFRGLIGKLDYLQDLGITALWLLPFYPSPLRDDGYDISDYHNINPIYGDLPDFKLFLREAHRRGLRVITELVVNHTSDQHPWFQHARRSPPGSKVRNFYVWSDTAEEYKEARIIFKDFEPSNWTWDPVANAYFWHRFYSHQPDLNYDNPEVQKAIFEVLDFWLGMGIDGLRLDAVPYLYEREGTNCENLPETHAFLKALRKHVDDKFGNRMLLAEANQWPEDVAAYLGDECHMAFHFPVMPRLFMAIRMEDRFPIIDILQQTPPIPETNQWALFLRNHDELTLEMVTDEDRDYMYRVYAQDPQARINLGIRRRLAPLLGNSRAKIELMNGLLFSLPGTPVLYYGDEIGMGDNIYLGDRNGVRTPMQWNGERNAGFSRANPQRLFLPVIMDPEYHYAGLNVETQQNQPLSLLWRTKHLIALRKRFRAFGRGSLEMLYPDNPRVLAFVRRHSPRPAAAADGKVTSEGEERILVVANLSRFIQYVELDLSAFKGLVPVEMLGRTRFPSIGDVPYLLTLGPYAIYWFTLEPQRTATLTSTAAERPLPLLKIAGRWESLFRGKSRTALEGLLPAYFKESPWFGRKAWTIEAAKVQEAIPISWDSSEAYLALVRVEYTEGDPETYVLPLALAAGEQAKLMQDGHSTAVICRLQMKHKENGEPQTQEAILYDALLDKEFCKTLLGGIMKRRRVKGTAGELRSFSLRGFRRLQEAEGPVPEPAIVPEPALMKVEQSNTCVVYGDKWLLKLFRKVEAGVHPELEMGRFLTGKVGFPHASSTVGAIEYRWGQGQSMTLGVLHGYVPHERDAWQYSLDSLGQYFERALTDPVRAEELSLPARPLLELAGEDLPARAGEVIGSYLVSVQLLGQRTGELHLALASAGAEDAHFAPEPFTGLYQRSLYQALRSQARQGFLLLRRRLKDLPEGAREDAQKILAREEEFLKRAHAIMERKITTQIIRIHGEYQLTRVLYTGKDFVIIGFDGEPGQPLSERRFKRSALRDVASMLRSFQYVAIIALRERALRPEDIPPLVPWTRFWYLWVSVAFLKAYLQATDEAPFLPRTLEERSVLLDFYLLKRAVNELRYELNTNPDRVRIPLVGLKHLLDTK